MNMYRQIVRILMSCISEGLTYFSKSLWCSLSVQKECKITCKQTFKITNLAYSLHMQRLQKKLVYGEKLIT